MKCVSCGCELIAGSKFCIQCGAEQPKYKECPKCKTQLPISAKFCVSCGHSFSSTSDVSPSSINIGDKNVIAGDVIGKQEKYNVSGNATFIRNNDESKKVVRCHVCFKNLTIINTHTCPICGQAVCDNCFDTQKGMCISCRDDNQISVENEYKDALKKVYVDGRVDLSERRALDALQTKIGLTASKASELENEIRYGKNNTNGFTTIEKLNIKDAKHLFYEEGDVKKAYELVTPIYKQHQFDEKILNLYLPIVAEYNSEQALQIIQNLKADMLTAYLAQIDIYTKKDLSKTERLLQLAERIWSDNFYLKCRRINWLYKVYKKTGRAMFYVQIKKVGATLGKVTTKLQKTWLVRIVSMLKADKGDLTAFTEDECTKKNIYRGFANSSLFIEKTPNTQKLVNKSNNNQNTTKSNMPFYSSDQSIEKRRYKAKIQELVNILSFLTK